MTARSILSHARYAILLFPIYGALSSFVQGCGGSIESHATENGLGGQHCDDPAGDYGYGYTYGYGYGEDDGHPCP